MFFLIVYLAIVEADNIIEQGNLISLRDYDFVGEDERLASLLAKRMAPLKTPVTFTAAEKNAGAVRRAPFRRSRPGPVVSPDLLELNLRSYPRVNVSMDYAELHNMSNPDKSNFDMNNFDMSNIDYDSLWTHPPHSVSNLNWTRDFRNEYGNGTSFLKVPSISNEQINMKILDIMKQSIYKAQTRLMEIDPVFKSYEVDERFRIAYIFNRLEEWKKDIRTIYYIMESDTTKVKNSSIFGIAWDFIKHSIGFEVDTERMPLTDYIYHYEHVLRKNIDVTYSIEYLIHLHSEYMKKVEKMFPRDQRERLAAAKKNRTSKQGGSMIFR